MRWVPWLLGIAGVLQFAVFAGIRPVDYVSLDAAYIVMWLAVIGGLLLAWIGCGWYGGGCDCCDEGCECGDGDCCRPHDDHDGHDHGEHGHTH